MNTQSVQVQTPKGLIQGTKKAQSLQFLGIPYARAEKRFRPAEPVPAWTGVFNADHYGKISYQGTLFGMTGENGSNNSNDCQNLNLWTPACDEKRRPVMVWLHGGGFSDGSANEAQYDGEKLAGTQDVVVIGVNHRLNAFGFLNLSSFGEDYKDSANVGMLDIVMALQWVRDNITCFGGDPDNVTIFGESGGGCKCLTLMASPAANGLFHKVIVESGVTHKMGIELTPAELTRQIGEKTVENLGLDAASIEKIQTLPWQQVLNAAYHARLYVGQQVKETLVLSHQYGIEWEPSTHTEFLPDGFFQPEGFTENAPGIPLLMGSNFSELTRYFEACQHLHPTEEEHTQFAYAYPQRPADEIRYCDSFIRIPTLKIMLHRSLQNTAPVYSYLFNEGQYPIHGAEIPYVFDLNGTELASRMSACWAAFARTGVPQAEGVPEWKPFDMKDGACMMLQNNCEIRCHHDTKLMELFDPSFSFWNQK